MSVNIQSHVGPEDVGHWMDMIFTITDTQISDEKVHLSLEAIAGGHAVGFMVEVPRHWRGAGEDYATLDFKQDSIKLTAMDQQSNNLILWMKAWCEANPSEDDEEFEDALDMDKIRPEFRFTGVNLGADDADVVVDSSRIKIFYEQELYFEMFLNVDVLNGSVTLNEKDQSYREEVLYVFEKRFGLQNH